MKQKRNWKQKWPVAEKYKYLKQKTWNFQLFHMQTVPFIQKGYTTITQDAVLQFNLGRNMNWICMERMTNWMKRENRDRKRFISEWIYYIDSRITE